MMMKNVTNMDHKNLKPLDSSDPHITTVYPP